MDCIKTNHRNFSRQPVSPLRPTGTTFLSMPLKSSSWNHILKTDDFFFSFNELKKYKLNGSLQNFQDSVGKHQKPKQQQQWNHPFHDSLEVRSVMIETHLFPSEWGKRSKCVLLHRYSQILYRIHLFHFLLS